MGYGACILHFGGIILFIFEKGQGRRMKKKLGTVGRNWTSWQMPFQSQVLWSVCGEGLDIVLNPVLIKKIRLRIRCILLEIWASYIIVEPTDSNVSRSLGTLVGRFFFFFFVPFFNFSSDLTSLGWPNHEYISSQAYPKINELQIDGLFMPRIFQILSL